VFDGVRKQLVEQGYEIPANVPVGIMVEVPSAVLVLQHMIREVDFVSVGTNDLVQYLLAVDRDNPWVSKLYDVHHPAVLLALAHVARVARDAGKPCSVCGEMAGDYATALLLMGMGYSSLSVAPNFLDEVKYAVRQTTLVEAEELAREVCRQNTSEDIRALLLAMRERLHQRQLGVNDPATSTSVSDASANSRKRET
jgi:phosphotransferase system enzyme I (PtsP)